MNYFELKRVERHAVD